MSYKKISETSRIGHGIITANGKTLVFDNIITGKLIFSKE